MLNELFWLYHVMFCPMIGYVPVEPRLITDPLALVVVQCRTCWFRCIAHNYDVEYDAAKEPTDDKSR